MECAVSKRLKNRKRKRSCRRNKRRVLRKLEVKGGTTLTTRNRKVFARGTSMMRDEPRSSTMQANAFWENYQFAQEWQQRHNVAWWRSRCYALEYENNILRNKVRLQASTSTQHEHRPFENKQTAQQTNITEGAEDDDEDDDENLEFQVDNDMLDFLEQSMRHKMELKRTRDDETKAAAALDAESNGPFVFGEARMLAKTEDARLLYGDSSPRIMAMEAALQATVDRHKDRTKPPFWPNVPLKP